MRSGARAFEDWEDELILEAAASLRRGAMAEVARRLGRRGKTIQSRRQWLETYRARPELQKRAMPAVVVPLARPAWFDEGDMAARLMAGR